jgi:ferrous iron transport protein B
MEDLLGSVEAGDAAAAVAAGKMFFNSALAGFSFLVFNLLCAPCFAAMGAIKREMNDWRWTAFAITYMCVFAYAISLMIYQFGSWFVGGGNIVGTVFAALTLALMVYMLVRRGSAAKTK